MNIRIPKRLAKIGGVLITISGVINIALGIRIGAIFYDVYPGGKMGHVGIIAGIVAVIIGLAIIFLIVRLYDRRSMRDVVVGALLTIILGHLGAIAGAIYIGTVGVLLCYIAGIWTIVLAVMRLKRKTV
jgi:uncharacterized BrkB/YihY/UPF0761 family membrane protein